MYVRVFSLNILENGRTVVGRSVVYNDNLKGKSLTLRDSPYPFNTFGYRPFFVVTGND
jgi:hypothetical protein